MVNARTVPPRASYDSQATASDASFDAHTKEYRDNDDDQEQGIRISVPKRGASRYTVDDDVELQLDDDEQVGLMQADRDAASPVWGKRRARGVWAGGMVFIGVMLGFALGLPVLQWLSGPTFSAAAPPSIGTTTPKPSTTLKQPSSPNTPAGNYALANTSTFSVDFHLPGWHNFATSSSGTGLPLSEVVSSTSHTSELMPLDMDIIFGGTLAPQTADFTWSEEDPDQGVFSHVDWRTRDIWLEDVTHARLHKTGEGKVAIGGGKSLIVQGKDVVDANGRMLDWTRYVFSPDVKWVLFFTSERQQWRYSKKSHVWLHDIVRKKTVPLGTGPIAPPKVSYAAWAPSPPNSREPPSIAYVEDNNLFVVPHAGDAAIQVTHDGAESIFNAVPDWVYEEEVFGADSVLWFSPGGTKLVFLRLDETEVPVYEFPKYNPDAYQAGKTTPYQQMVGMKYPKPGYANPTVGVKLVDLDEIRAGATGAKVTQYSLQSPRGDEADAVDQLLSSQEGRKERLVTEVKWVSDAELLVKETDRVSDVMRMVRFDLASKRTSTELVGQVVRRHDARADHSGWIRAAQTIEPLSHHNLSVASTAYLDIVVSPQGFRHLAYYPSALSAEPTFLTSGNWEIAELKHVDAKRRRAYFVAARPTPAQRHVYWVELPNWTSSSATTTYTAKEPTALTDVSKPGYYDVDFDPKGGYYVLHYQGPDVPYQKVVGVDDGTFELMLEDNKLLRQISSQYVRPWSVFYQLSLNGTLADGSSVTASVKEIRPHDFDATGATRYPVLMRVYGGPDSQLVDARWDRADWHQYVASTLGYIVVVVDGRGTGFKGQAYRGVVARNLGKVEAQDVNQAASLVSSLPYVDETRLGLWGWSYGGYLTAKSIELNRHLFSLAISVAPVTKWQFYDSVYTERYLKHPLTNPTGYQASAVHITDGFRKTKFLLMQGSADDNVHFSNSAHLLDLLTKSKVRGFRFRMFTDSAHSMRVRGAYRELFEELSGFLSDEWGSGGKRGASGKARPGLHNSVE